MSSRLRDASILSIFLSFDRRLWELANVPLIQLGRRPVQVDYKYSSTIGWTRKEAPLEREYATTGRRHRGRTCLQDGCSLLKDIRRGVEQDVSNSYDSYYQQWKTTGHAQSQGNHPVFCKQGPDLLSRGFWGPFYSIANWFAK